MDKLLSTCIATLLSLALHSISAEAQPVLAQRCAADTLTAATAEARINWARRCALVMRIGDPEAYDFDSPPLYEYTEYDAAFNPWGINSYIGPMYGYSINYTTTACLYNSGGTSVGRDALGYYYWFRAPTRRKPRPLYPIYGSLQDVNNSNNQQLFPHPTNPNDCDFYLDKTGTISAEGRAFYVNAYCEPTP